MPIIFFIMVKTYRSIL